MFKKQVTEGDVMMVESSVWKDKCAGNAPWKERKVTDPGALETEGQCAETCGYATFWWSGYIYGGIHSEAQHCYYAEHPVQKEETEAEGVAGTR